MSEPDPDQVGLDHPWHQQLFPDRPADSSWIRFKKASSGWAVVDD